MAGGEGALFVGLAPELASSSAACRPRTSSRPGSRSRPTTIAGSSPPTSPASSANQPARSVIYSPDDLGEAERSLYCEAGPALDLGKQFNAFATIGHRARKAGDDYTSFNAGASTTIVPRMTLDLRWYDTSRHELGENLQGRAVVTARMAF